MNEDWQQQQPYRPPSPYVTHQEMGPIHSRLGSVERGQQATLDAYNHLRGDMLSGFDRLATMIRQQSEEKREDVRDEKKQTGLPLPTLAVVIAGSVLAGMALANSSIATSLLGVQ